MSKKNCSNLKHFAIIINVPVYHVLETKEIVKIEKFCIGSKYLTALGQRNQLFIKKSLIQNN